MTESTEGHPSSESSQRTVTRDGAPSAHPDEELRERATTEQALRRLLEFERLVTELSTGFINVADSDLDRAIHDALGAIGQFAGVDRSYVFLFSEDLTLATNSHEWCAPGVEPEIENLQELPTEHFSWWMKLFLRFENAYVPAVRDLPLDDESPREFLESQGIQALVAVPLLHGSRLLGFLGFDSVHCSRTWDERELTLLRLVGDILANAIHRRRANRRLAETEAELRMSQKLEALGRLAGGIAHDFNNLLTAIGGNASLLATQLDPGDSRTQLLEEISGAVHRASSLTQQLLVFGRPRAGAPQVLDLNQVITDGQRLYRRFIREDVELEFALDPELGSVEIDRGQLEQVLLNLLLNARDAVSPGGRIRIATGSLRAPPDSPPVSEPPGSTGHVVLIVEDDGHGMDGPTRSKLFEPFFTTKEVGQGTGLGLSTVYGIVHRQGGWIDVHSEPGKGARFEVVFPAVQAAPVVQREAPGPIRLGTGTVLVVEDERPVLTLIGRLLRAEGFDVLEASDGASALEKTLTDPRRIDLLVTDVVMPQMGGSELDRTLRRHHPNLKTLFISGYPGHRADERLTATGFLQKPFTPQELFQAIETVLDPGAAAAEASEGPAPRAADARGNADL